MSVFTANVKKYGEVGNQSFDVQTTSSAVELFSVRPSLVLGKPDRRPLSWKIQMVCIHDRHDRRDRLEPCTSARRLLWSFLLPCDRQPHPNRSPGSICHDLSHQPLQFLLDVNDFILALLVLIKQNLQLVPRLVQPPNCKMGCGQLVLSFWSDSALVLFL